MVSLARIFEGWPSEDRGFLSMAKAYRKEAGGCAPKEMAVDAEEPVNMWQEGNTVLEGYSRRPSIQGGSAWRRATVTDKNPW